MKFRQIRMPHVCSLALYQVIYDDKAQHQGLLTFEQAQAYIEQHPKNQGYLHIVLALESLIGKRIKLIAMQDDPCPIPKGEIGKVYHVSGKNTNMCQVCVKWECQRSLNLCFPKDEFEIIDEQSEDNMEKQHYITNQYDVYFRVDVPTLNTARLDKCQVHDNLTGMYEQAAKTANLPLSKVSAREIVISKQQDEYRLTTHGETSAIDITDSTIEAYISAYQI